MRNRQKLQPLPNLWHTLLLFTPGEIAQRKLGLTEKLDYVRYPFCKLQLTPAEQTALERDWQPYLAGKTSFEQAKGATNHWHVMTVNDGTGDSWAFFHLP
jgi:hypothetical protein